MGGQNFVFPYFFWFSEKLVTSLGSELFMDIFLGSCLFFIMFLGSSIILSNFLGFAHFLGNLFISITIRILE